MPRPRCKKDLLVTLRVTRWIRIITRPNLIRNEWCYKKVDGSSSEVYFCLFALTSTARAFCFCVTCWIMDHSTSYRSQHCLRNTLQWQGVSSTFSYHQKKLHKCLLSPRLAFLKKHHPGVCFILVSGQMMFPNHFCKWRICRPHGPQWEPLQSAEALIPHTMMWKK